MFWIQTFFGADPDPEPGTGTLADPDPDPNGSRMIPMNRARNSDQFTFLKFENPSTGSKIISHQSRAHFCIKSIFLQIPSSKLRLTLSNWPKITLFGSKVLTP